MSRILKRPMFRIGGSANNQGIMSGVVPTRAGYAEPQDAANPLDNYQLDPNSSTYKKAMMNAALYEKFAGAGPSMYSDLGDLLIGGGLNLLSGTGAGKGNLGAIAQAYKEPYAAFSKARAGEDAFKRQLRLTGLTEAIKSEEAQAKYDKEMKIAQMKLEQDKYQSDRDAFIKANADLGGKAIGIFDTLRQLKKGNAPVQEIRVESTITNVKGKKIPKPNAEEVASVPEGTIFWDNFGFFYKKSKDTPGGFIRLERGGQQIPTPPPVTKTQELINNVTETSPDDIIMRQYLGPAADLLRTKKYEGGMTTVDPRPWNKQKFYEDLLKKNKASME